MSENLESNGVRVTLEWLTPENQTSYSYSYNITVIPQIAFMITEGTRIKLKVSYNTIYNVSILITLNVVWHRPLNYTMVSTKLFC